MTKDEALTMALEAGYKDLPTVRLAYQGFDIQHFTNLVIAAERHRVLAEERAALAQPPRTRPANSQDWAGMDGATAFHLIERHSDNWSDASMMMDEWRLANPVAQPEQPEHGPSESKKMQVTLQDSPMDVEIARYKRMFESACFDLGLINEALGLDPDDGGAEPILEAIAALKAVIAQPEQEPVAKVVSSGEYNFPMLQWISANHSLDTKIGSLLYTSPPQRQPLTDEEIWQMVNDCSFNRDLHADKFARAIEAKLKDKNNAK